jgi:hypothetical protein
VRKVSPEWSHQSPVGTLGVITHRNPTPHATTELRLTAMPQKAMMVSARRTIRTIERIHEFQTIGVLLAA